MVKLTKFLKLRKFYGQDTFLFKYVLTLFPPEHGRYPKNQNNNNDNGNNANGRPSFKYTGNCRAAA